MPRPASSPMSRRPVPRFRVVGVVLGIMAILEVFAAGPAVADPIAGPPPAGPAPAEVRGTWLTTTANDALQTPTRTHATMRSLREIGLNTVYVETWKNGYTQFPSPTLRQTLGVERRPDLLPGHPNYPSDTPGLRGPRDLLEESLIAAHRNQLIYVAWFEYGFMAAFKDTDNHLRRQKPDWLTTTADGELVSSQNPFVWMNPLRPETREILLGIVLDAVDRYDLDGVQLDDRIAWPVTMGYDPFTVERYRLEHDGRPPPADPRDPAWVAWRAEKVGEFARMFYHRLKEARPNLIVSISPAVYPWSLEHYACDWAQWSRRGWMDEYMPQVYRPTFARVDEDWPVQLEAVGPGRADDLIGGFAVVGSGPDTPWDDYRRMMEMVRRRGGGGHCHWFSRGVLEVYPEQFRAFYDVANHGPAPHPKLPADWRPPPIVASQDPDTQTWRARLTEAGAYRVIVHRGDVWTRLSTGDWPAGEIEMQGVPDDVQAVELLVDRRQAAPLDTLRIR